MRLKERKICGRKYPQIDKGYIMKTFETFLEEQKLFERKFVAIGNIPRNIQMLIAKVIKGNKKSADDPKWSVSDDNVLNNWLEKNAAKAQKKVGGWAETHLGGMFMSKPVGNSSKWILMPESVDVIDCIGLNEGDVAGWIAIYNSKKLEIKKGKDAKDLSTAKDFAIKHFKVPKSKQGLLAIKPGYDD
jgi:hypothetical protein